jgi:hypothetical protein
MEVNMYRFAPFVIRFTLALLLIAGLFVGANALYRAGLSNGYAQGLAASAQTAPGEQIVPRDAAPLDPYGRNFYPPYYRPFYGPHFGFFPFPFFGIFCLALLLPLFFFGLFRPWRHHAWGQHGPHGWDGPPWMKHAEPEKPGEGAGQPPVAPAAPE